MSSDRLFHIEEAMFDKIFCPALLVLRKGCLILVKLFYNIKRIRTLNGHLRYNEHLRYNGQLLLAVFILRRFFRVKRLNRLNNFVSSRKI